jgi:transglutaminase/protease-like cytokinesis protein 3
MKRLLLCALLGVASISAYLPECKAQNIDSLVYADQDTTGLAKSIAEEEAAWRWTDTLTEVHLEKVDTYALSLTKKYKNIPDLAKDLTAPFTKNEDKVRSIFIWVVANIAYDEIELAQNRKKKGKYEINISSRDSQSEITKKYQEHYYQYATKVLRNKRGICEGYSTLFYELCRASVIECELVNGYADKDVMVVAKYKKRNVCPTVHAWNKVKINEEWLYVDVTWASKNIYNGKRYESEYYNPKYYLVTEDKLYDTHIENKKRSQLRNALVGNY